MMYNQKLAACIKVAGKVLRENKDTVRIPFGSEYSILIKNLNTVKALVNVYIDGVDVGGGGFVIHAGQELDLERWIKNNNLAEGNKFKFIERTGAVEDHRGVGIEDGVVRIEYKFEKVYQRQDGPTFAGNPIWQVNHSTYSVNSLTAGDLNSINLNNISGSLGTKQAKSSGISGSTLDAYGSVTCSSVTPGSVLRNSVSLNNISLTKGIAEPVNDAGITVPGSKSEQKFATANWFATEYETHSIVLKLIGKTKDNEPVTEAITVKHKPKCVTCGKLNKANSKFCNHCGTALEIFA